MNGNAKSKIQSAFRLQLRNLCRVYVFLDTRTTVIPIAKSTIPHVQNMIVLRLGVLTGLHSGSAFCLNLLLIILLYSSTSIIMMAYQYIIWRIHLNSK